jgi:hypothetical protein
MNPTPHQMESLMETDCTTKGSGDIVLSSLFIFFVLNVLSHSAWGKLLSLAPVSSTSIQWQEFIFDMDMNELLR